MVIFDPSRIVALNIFDDIGNFFTEDIPGFFTDIGDTISSGFEELGDIIVNSIETVLENTIFRLFYYIVCGICKIIHYLDQMFKVFSGQTPVKYDGNQTYLINLFFSNHTVSNVYMGMAMLGIVLSVAVAMIAVARKMFDGRDKDRRSLGQILGSLAKSLFLTISMNLIILIVLTLTNLLMTQVTYVFDNADALDQQQSIDFTDEQYAAMGRVLNTIGNYSLSESEASSYNINSCFNEIRPDLNYLSRQGVFDFYYESKNARGETIETWQSVLQNIAHSRNLTADMKVDVYDEGVSNSIKYAMQVIKTNKNFRPLSHYDRQYKPSATQLVPLDRYVFLIGTLEAAKNPQYNTDPDLADGLRGPFYYGDKDIYDFDQVRAAFSLSPANYSYLTVLLLGLALGWNLIVIIFSCISRIFVMLLLYIICPLIFAFEPWDDGEKTKQWANAFIIQAFGVLGTVIAMRVLLLFIPIITSSKLELFDSVVLNLLGKVALIYGGYSMAKRASSIVGGILANNGGFASNMLNAEAAKLGANVAGMPKKVIGAVINVASGGAVGGGKKK